MYSNAKLNSKQSSEKFNNTKFFVVNLTDAEHQGRRLKELIKHYRITQVVLSQQLGISKSYVSLILSGKEEISRNVLNKLAESFEMLNLDWFIRGRGSMLYDLSAVDMVNESQVEYHAGEGVLEALLRQQRALENRINEIERRQAKEL